MQATANNSGPAKYDAKQAAALTAGQPAVEPFISKREVARRLGRTARAVDALMRKGTLPYYKWDSRPAFRWSEVMARLVKTCRNEGGAE